ncbi:MAG: TRAP transporter large permease subunit [Deltaproteobacteria bacterium]|nr:TRAP transporter large permease subunit [Deltaproteobacteria bacterium]
METSMIIGIVFIALFVLFITGVPIFVCLGLSGLIGMFLQRGMQGLYQLPAAILGQLDSFLLVALPLYIMMGEALSRSGVGADIYDGLEKWLQKIPGGLAIASIFACAIFGAMCGVSVAGCAAIGLVAVPEMLKRGYDKSLASGSVTAAGALAVLIPPSISFIIYGALANVSVGKLFIGGIIPGITLAIMMATYVLLRVIVNPSLAPLPKIQLTWQQYLAPLTHLWSVIFLIFCVLGTIYTGVCTPTEAGGIGAAGAFVVAWINRKLSWNTFKEILQGTARVTGIIMIIMANAFAFSQWMNLVRIPDDLSKWIIGLNAEPIVVILIIMGFFVILGCLIDGVSLIIVTTPVVLPTILKLGFDPLWYGILLVLNLEMAVITPPVGLNLYTMKSIMGDRVTMEEIIRGALPYVIVESLCLLLFLFWPTLALWLPSKM